ncbi:MAG: helix-turn-helix transcriptional regulator [Pirellulaceae bacterium]|jgi:transcriptional regulator with XRE-family HTH domain|nr:helix-turn-helix transcriptional regulator [Thermoguttaceae bacterium]MDI9446332.1 helix-turn-helix transcriptional regulator [Planctomycetota bacterium]NLZ00531.1 helix-turn-helix transcriptional regulator [Pirellulaceae bacterium]
MKFGDRIRDLRKSKNLSQRALGDIVGVTFTYISKIESEKLDFGDYPSEDLIRRLAEALDTDVDELFLLAKKIPQQIRQRVMERPDAFRKFASLDDETLNKLLKDLEDG